MFFKKSPELNLEGVTERGTARMVNKQMVIPWARQNKLSKILGRSNVTGTVRMGEEMILKLILGNEKV